MQLIVKIYSKEVFIFANVLISQSREVAKVIRDIVATCEI